MAVMKVLMFLFSLIFVVQISQSAPTTADIQKLKDEIKTLKENMKKFQWQLSAYNGYCEIHNNKCGTCTCIEDLNLMEKHYCGCQNKPIRRDCKDHFQAGERTSGVYKITANVPGRVIQVFCDQETDGGGWTVFQRRLDGSANFFRNWDEYKKGFGKFHHEHWLGNENLFYITAQAFLKGSQLRVDMLDRGSSNKIWAKYSYFDVDNERKGFLLHVSGYSGNAGDRLTYNNNMKFTTYNRDNDKNNKGNCAIAELGAWWYNFCTDANLNGAYDKFGQLPLTKRVSWTDIPSHKVGKHLQFTEMKVRRN